jgi:hypothetical protein
VALAACSSSSDDAATTTPPVTAPPALAGSKVLFDLSADTSTADGFFRMPYPSDTRLLNGAPDVRGWPNPAKLALIEGLRTIALERQGFPVTPVAYFNFSDTIATHDVEAVYPADKSSPVLLLDIDEASPDRGTLTPTVATAPPLDDYVTPALLAVAPRPGFILHPKRTYAFVVMRSYGDATGAPLGSPAELESLKAGLGLPGDKGAALTKLYAPLWATLKTAGVDAAQVAAATVFTTGDVVADLADLSGRIADKYKVTITDLQVDPDDGAAHESYCELTGKVVYPQFQRGTPPFDTDGHFDFAGGDLPVKQRDEEARVTLTLPKIAMPAGGYPLTVYFHGSGGLSTAVVDRGTWHVESDVSRCPGAPGIAGTLDEWNGTKGCNTKGEGPAHVLGPHGIGMASTSLPLNPERLPGAEETAYLNFNNLSAFRDTFRQGVSEQRMFIEALGSLTIPPEVVAACSGLSLPAGETAYHYSLTQLSAQGQSMGGMYTNMIGATEPKIKAVVPTGAGGFWSYFILKTHLLDNIEGKVKLVLSLSQQKEPLTFLHPALHMLQTAWEPTDPVVYMPRLARRPLPMHPVRSIYEPVGKDDSYFPTPLYDAVALSYGHREAGEAVWPTMQDALKLASLDGLITYPISSNLTSADGTKYTGAVIQYNGDGIYDPHALYSQLDVVKHQYGCFLRTFLDGNPTIVAPAPVGTPCQ